MPQISLFGWLDNFDWWKNLPYPAKGAILRALKSALSLLVSALLAIVTAGLLFPEGSDPAYVLVVTTVLTSVLQGLDKFLREWNIEQENKNELDALTDNPTGV